MRNHFLKKLVFLLLISMQGIAQDGKYTFNMPSAARTSAGVFKDDSILIKTLWNDERYEAGSYTKYWDGTDDWGKKITSPASSYKIKVLTNNVQYAWQGTIGNTSDSMTGLSKMKGLYDCMKGLAFAGRYGYYCTGYGEGASSTFKFDTAQPNRKILIYPATLSTGNLTHVTTDGTTVYYACFDPFDQTNTWVFGINVSNDLEKTFSSGISYTPTHTKNYPNAISKLVSSNGLITGIAVQKTGNYLFVARADRNELQVLNKNTGAVVQTLSYTGARNICVDANNNLWMVSGTNTVARYSVNADGTLAAPIITLAGLIDPVATQVSPDGIRIGVADGATSQQVKFFNNATGTPLSTLGTAGGYVPDATVTDNKFYFNDARGKRITFLAFEPGGDYWVNDPGNYRVQHYNSSGTYINKIMSLPSIYSTWVDRNNVNRVFASFLEFNVDYNTPLSGTTGWSLTKNWGATISPAYDADIFCIRHQNTLSNGRTYAFVKVANENELVELPATGPLRFTGVKYSAATVLCSDGSLQVYEEGSTSFTCKRYPLTGFNGSNLPIWSSTGELVVTGAKKDDTPITFPSAQIFDSTNKVVFFNGHSMLGYNPPTFTTGYHLAVMSKGSNDVYLAKTEKSTHRNYGGDYPGPGWFDIGNTVNDYAGGTVNIMRRNIITSYHGEFWKASQANKFNHYYDNGLAIGQFGITGDQTRAGYADSLIAGNVLSPCLIMAKNGNMYMIHGDESAHAGVHIWKISGLETIAEQVLAMPFPVSYTEPAADFLNLMAGLPFDSVLANNTHGWTRNPTIDNPRWKVKTSVLTYDGHNKKDLLIAYDEQTPGTSTVNRDLGTNNVSKFWKISGNIFWGATAVYNSNPVYLYFEILDDAGKVLSVITLEKTGAHPVFDSYIKGNGKTIFSKHETYSPTLDSLISRLRPFEISTSAGFVTFKYSNFPAVTTSISDASGDWHKPKTLRVRWVHNGASGTAYGGGIAFSDLKLYKDNTIIVPVNRPPVANAGTDQAITLPVNTATLTGNGTDPDGSISSYAWVKIAGPATGTIVSGNAATTALNSLVQGVYQFELTVTDNEGATAKDTVQVAVNVMFNRLPTANAGTDQSITLPVNTTTLTGIGTDTDGTISSYSWIKISGPAPGTIASPSAATTVLNSLVQGIYQYQLTVTDNNGATAKDTVQVTVNAMFNNAPTANAGTDQSITLPVNTTTLTGIGTDIDGTISSYAWTKISGPAPGAIASASAATTVLNSLVQGIYQYQLTVTDNSGATAKDTVQVTVNAIFNKAPTANAGTDQSITLPVNSTTLKGTGTDTDGTISSYSWIKISGPAPGTIASPSTAITVLNSLVQGVYQYQLTVTDNNGATARDTVQVTVNAAVNNAPTANAGTDQSITLPVNTTTLAGTGTDTDGSISSYAWVKISGPATGTIASASAATTVLNSLVQGVYQYQLTVTDNSGATAKDTVQVTVNAVVNKAPTANAGTDQSITLPVNTTTLTGVGTDTDGSISSYAWVKISGPASGTIVSASAATTVLNSLVQGVYQYQLTVTDNSGATAKDTVQVTVNAAANQAPIANAGADIDLVLPTNSAFLVGTGSDADGSIAAYSWKIISGPSGANILNTSLSSTIIENLFQGVYLVELMVTDDRGAKGMDTLSIVVSSPRLSTNTVNEFKIYPNPVKDITNLSINTVNSNTRISISVTDHKGSLVRATELVTQSNTTIYSLDVSNLSSGQYTVTIRFDDGSIISSKLIKQGGN